MSWPQFFQNTSGTDTYESKKKTFKFASSDVDDSETTSVAFYSFLS